MSIARYSRDVNLHDLENVHTIAVLAVPRGSRVLDLGAATGSVAAALAARGCDVTAVEREPEGIAALEARGLRAVAADLATLDEDSLPREAFDVVLLLDVIEHLADPRRLLALVPAWLAPGGRVIVSVPHVAHAAVRLALLQGRFPRTDTGLLDRTHLQFFDRPALDALLAGAGLGVLDVLTVERDLHEAGIPIDEDAFPAEVIEAATADPDSRVYQFVVVARNGPPGAGEGGLLQALQGRARDIEASYRALEGHASRIDAELLVTRERLGDIDVGTVHGGGAPGTPRAPGGRSDVAIEDVVADRDTLRRQLRERMQELDESRATIHVLLQDVAVQRDFAESLVGRSDRLADLERALVFRIVARIDATLRRVPRMRAVLRRAARALSGR